MLFFNLSAFYFFYFSAVGVYVIYLPKVLHDIGYSAFEIGVVLAVAPLMRFAIPFLFLKHIKLDQRIFKISLFLSIVATAFFYLSIKNFYLFMINNALLASCLSLILPYIEVTAIKYLGKDKYGKSRLFGSIGFMFISLVLAKFLTTPFVAVHYYLIINTITVIFALLLIKYDDNIDENEATNEPFDLFKHWAFWLSLFFMQISFGAFYNFFTIYETQHNISLEMTSYLWIFGVFCEVLMLLFQSPILKNNLLAIIKFCVAITVFRWLLIYLYPDSLSITFFAQSIHAFSFGLYHSAVIMYLYTLYDNKKLAQQFMYGVAYGLGGFIGALISGLVYGEFLFLFSAMFSLVSLISLYFVKQSN